MINNKIKANGFTLPEALATVAIVGILSTIAVPKYINQVDRTRQSDAASTIAQMNLRMKLQTKVQGGALAIQILGSQI